MNYLIFRDANFFYGKGLSTRPGLSQKKTTLLDKKQVSGVYTAGV